jgi:hypothetical protein
MAGLASYALFILGLLLSTALLSAVGNPNILELDSPSLQEAAIANEFLFVAFVAPWCSHCNALTEELRLVALELSTRTSRTQQGSAGSAGSSAVVTRVGK